MTSAEERRARWEAQSEAVRRQVEATPYQPADWERQRELDDLAKHSYCTVCRSRRIIVIFVEREFRIKCDCWPAAPMLAANTTRSFVAEKLGGMVMTQLARRPDKDISALTAPEVKEYFCPEASEQEAGLFLRFCLAQDLNPFIGDAYLVKYRGTNPKASIIIGYNVHLRRATRHPEFAGYNSGVVTQDASGAIHEREGTMVWPGETLLGGWARVHRKNFVEPVTHRVSLEEYTKDRQIWKDIPATMISIRALSQATKRVFPETEREMRERFGDNFYSLSIIDYDSAQAEALMDDAKLEEINQLEPTFNAEVATSSPVEEDEAMGMFGDPPIGGEVVDTETGEILTPEEAPPGDAPQPSGEAPAAPAVPANPDDVLSPEAMDKVLTTAEKAGLTQAYIERSIGGPIETHWKPWLRERNIRSMTDALLRLQ